jgi:hypothetical protein
VRNRRETAGAVIVILCHADDAPALWLHGALRGLGLKGLELVAIDQLVYSRRIVHRLGDDGDRGEIRLADGRVLRAESISGLINRVRYLPTQHFAGADPSDRAYATQELSAFMLAWLDSIAGRVINPPLPFALDGGTFQPTTVLHHAAMAGLPTRTWRAGTTAVADNVEPEAIPTHAPIVFDGRLFGRIMPRNLQDGCVRVAALLGVPLLQILLHHSADLRWRFVAATGIADFRIGGRPLAAAIARAFAPAQ